MDLSQFISVKSLLVEGAVSLGVVGLIVAIRRIAVGDVAQRLYSSYAPLIFNAIDSYYGYAETVEETPKSFADVVAAAFEVARQRNPEIELELRPTITRYILQRLDRDFSPIRHEAMKEQFKTAQQGLVLGRNVSNLLTLKDRRD